MKHLFVPLTVVLLNSAAGCSSCGKEDESVVVPSATPGVKSTTSKTSSPASAGRGMKGDVKNLPKEGYLLMVQVSEDDARVWVEGARKSNQYPMANVHFSEAGFQFERNGVSQVLGTGGGYYYRMGTHGHALQPLSEFPDAAGEAPAGYEIQSNIGRSGLYRVQLKTNGNGEVPFGSTYKTAPLGTYWMAGELPAGQVSASLHTQNQDSGRIEELTLDWPTEEGVPLSQLPEGCAEIQSDYQPDLEEIWLEDLGQIRNGEVEIKQAMMLDLDRDDEDEAVVCVTGGQGEWSCFVVDTVGAERRYFWLNLGLNGDEPLMAFSWKGGHYVSWVGRHNRSTRETDQEQLFIVRFDGGGYVTEFQTQ